MKKHNGLILIIVMIVMTLALGGIFVYEKYYYPSQQTYNTYLAVHQEIDASEIKNIVINSINHNIEIRPSSDEKIKIIYYQKTDNTNVYSLNRGELSLKIPERVESINSFFFKSDKRIDTIVIYLPTESKIVFNASSTLGKLSVEDVGLKSIKFENVNGDIVIKNVKCPSITCISNTCQAIVSKSEFDNLDLSVVSGKINVDILNSIYEYQSEIVSTYGSIVLNEEDVFVEDEQGNKKVELIIKEKSSKKIKITSTRCPIEIISQEPEEQQDQTEVTE